MGIMEDLGKGPVFFDTCVFIYFIEESRPYIDIVAQIFEAISEGRISAATSGITLFETLVVPLRTNDVLLASRYKEFLCESEGLTILNLDDEVLYKGALLKAQLGVKTPDALQIAAAQVANCTTFITNDRRLPKIPGLQILQLSDYL